MNTTQLKEFAQLSQASYAYFRSIDIGNAQNTAFDLQIGTTGDFTKTEAKLFTDRYELVNQSSDTFAALGFSASLFRDKQQNKTSENLRVRVDLFAALN